jgi:hypothetical protein
LEQTIRGAKHLPAADIVRTIVEDLKMFADPVDDVSLVVPKKRCWPGISVEALRRRSVLALNPALG